MTDFERINAVMEAKGFHTIRKFAAACNLPQQNLYDIKGDKCRMTSRVAEAIVAAYPDVDYKWLLHGEGTPSVSIEPPVPCYNSENFYDFGYVDGLRETIQSQKELIATQRELIDSLKEQIALLKNNAHKNERTKDSVSERDAKR